MSNSTKWRSIKTAPKDGQMIITQWSGRTVMASHFYPEGWRILILGRDGEYGIHGNYAAFEPEVWLPHTDIQIANHKGK